LAEDRLTAGLIADGLHLPPAVIKCFLRAKTPERCFLVSDLVALAGQPPGRYQLASLGAIDVLADGRLIIAGQSQLLAGASLPITVGIVHVMQYAGASLQTAVDLASLQPAALLGLPADGLHIGAAADLVLFRLSGADGVGPLGQLEVMATLRAGRPIYTAPEVRGEGPAGA
jgi:N-acetylglucosamine-6-phosphate deacetylase